MCRNHPNHKNSKKRNKSPRYRFYRNLRGFMIFNLVMFILGITGNGFGAYWEISAIWSIFLVISYVRAFGLPGTHGWFSDDWEAWMAEREAKHSSFSSVDADVKDWKEKDLV